MNQLAAFKQISGTPTLGVMCFRRDLRLSDNEMVTKAAERTTHQIGLYIFDPFYTGHAEHSLGRDRFVIESLHCLRESLRLRGTDLLLCCKEPALAIEELLKAAINSGYRPTLFLGRDVQYPEDIARDQKIEAAAKALNVETFCGENDFMLKDEADMDSWREQYYQHQRSERFHSPQIFRRPEMNADRADLLAEMLKQTVSDKSSLFCGGSVEAHRRLKQFLEHDFRGYHWRLSRPALASRGATSLLSPHIAQGTISSREIYQAVKTKEDSLDDRGKFSLRSFRDRLRWRDSFRQRFYFHPEWTWQNVYGEFDELYSQDELSDEQKILYDAWREGQTGFALVDASMRQLKTQGWMNFRMRAMCATFLTINCGISWHHGATHFMNHLIDGDAAIDHWQWQMQAGITNPLTPTFRIYNPSKNIAERDPELFYIRRWVPELAGYELDEVVSGRAEYIKPILDWSSSRRLHGDKVAQIRNNIRNRLLTSGGEDCAQALIATRVVQHYYKGKRAQYEKMKGIEQLKLF